MRFVMVVVMPAINISKYEIGSNHFDGRGVYEHTSGDGGHDALYQQHGSYSIAAYQLGPFTQHGRLASVLPPTGTKQ
jgi:hypothetical protein